MRLLAVLMLAAGATCFAQGPRGFFPWWDSPLAKDLNLTSEQTRQIGETVKEYRIRLIDQRATVDKAEAILEDLFNESNVDQRKANEGIEQLAAARADLTRTLSQMTLRLRMVLNPDQWAELQKRQPRGMHRGPEQMKMRPGGPGGPGRPGGPPTQQ